MKSLQRVAYDKATDKDIRQGIFNSMCDADKSIIEEEQSGQGGMDTSNVGDYAVPRVMTKREAEELEEFDVYEDDLDMMSEAIANGICDDKDEESFNTNIFQEMDDEDDEDDDEIVEEAMVIRGGVKKDFVKACQTIVDIGFPSAIAKINEILLKKKMMLHISGTSKVELVEVDKTGKILQEERGDLFDVKKPTSSLKLFTMVLDRVVKKLYKGEKKTDDVFIGVIREEAQRQAGDSPFIYELERSGIDFYDYFDNFQDAFLHIVISDEIPKGDIKKLGNAFKNLVKKATIFTDKTGHHTWIIIPKVIQEENEVFVTDKSSLPDTFAEMLEEASIGEKMREKRRKSRQMKRLSGKMGASRKRKAKRMDMATIKKRVHKQAIKLVKDKFAKKKGGSYDSLPMAVQVRIDEKVKTKQALITRFERKLLKKYRTEKASKGKSKESDGGK